MTRGDRGALARLARAHGIQLAYTSASKRRVVASEESLMGALRALGIEIPGPEAAVEVLRSTEGRDSADAALPVAVVWQGDRSPNVALGGTAPRRSRLRGVIELEDGAERVVRLEPAVGEFPSPRYALPADLPTGYHRLRLEEPRRSTEVLLIVAPDRAYSSRAQDQSRPQRGSRPWGVFLPLYAVTTRQTWAVADYSDLDSAVRWAARRGAAAFGTLPLLPAFLESPFDPSPYAPVSRIFWNELYVDPRATPEFKACEHAREAFERLTRRARTLGRASLIDYRATWELKRELFQHLSKCGRSKSDLAARADEFVRRNPEVGRYAAFRAAGARLGGAWTSWPERMRGGVLRPADYDRKVAAMYEFLQRAAAEQLLHVGRHKAAEGTGLYLDLPVGVSGNGYDVWSNRGLFAHGASAGAPPDLFFSKGQDWGFPPFSPAGLRADGYRHWRLVLHHHMQFATMLRIDHVMGLHRMFFVPAGMAPTEGVYVRFPTEELYAVLTLESHRARTSVVGEDLGTVPRHVGTEMRRRGLSQMYAAYFQVDPERAPPVATPSRHMVAFLNTHDMSTFQSYWTGEDTELRLALGVVDPAAAATEKKERARVRKAVAAFLRRHGLLDGRGGQTPAGSGAALLALLRFLATSPASFLLVALEDLWLEESPQNVPGTTDQHPNWRRRARHALEHWDQVGGVRKILEEVARIRGATKP